MTLPLVYVDTHGASKSLSRRAPTGVRIAVHLTSEVAVEFNVEPNGQWSVSESPRPSSINYSWRTLAKGRIPTKRRN